MKSFELYRENRALPEMSSSIEPQVGLCYLSRNLIWQRIIHCTTTNLWNAGFTSSHYIALAKQGKKRAELSTVSHPRHELEAD